MNNTISNLEPTKVTNRIALIDIFRGFALFGIFAVNIRYMTSSVLHPEAFHWMIEGRGNAFTWQLMDMFFNGKFFPIFSFLFGVGFGMQINKMEEKQNFSIWFFIRRYSVLLLFGLFHLVFLWGGDVLILYSLAGFLILVIRKIKLKWIYIGIAVILLFPYYYHIHDYAYKILKAQGLQKYVDIKPYEFLDIVNINMNGSILDHIKFRIYEYTVYFRNVSYFPTLLAMVLLGYAAGRVKFYNNIPQTFKKMRPLFFLAIPMLIILHFIFLFEAIDQNESYFLYILFRKLWTLNNLATSFIYLYLISLLYEFPLFKKILEPFAYAGRMSLTNYLMQSVVGLFLFNGLFFGLYGKFGYYWLFLISTSVFILMLIVSKIWSTKFRYGPFEWVWRELTYKSAFSYLKIKLKKNNKN